MAFRFDLNEPLAEGTRRIGRQQIERAVASLRQVEGRATAVHDTRKALKRMRALLWLVRPALSRSVFRHENERYRGIAELLSGTRDAQVMSETLAKLQAGADDGDAKNIATMAALFTKRLHDTTASAGHVQEAVVRLEQAEQSWHDLPMAEAGFEAAFEGMETVYRRGRKAMTAAYADPGDEAFHEWRKQVQRHWRHMALLSRAWPQAMEARVALAKELSDVLGDDHDLTVLLERIEGMGRVKVRAAVAQAARRAQDDLRARGVPLGERLFAARAGEIRREIAVYWRSACALSLTKAGAGDRDKGEPAADATPKAVALIS